MKKIIVYSHNPVRDSVTDDLLAVALRKAGHTVWKRSYLDRDRESIVIIKPDMIIMPEIRCEYSVDFVRICKQWGIQVVVRPCEVGISEESIPHITEDYRRAIFGENWPVNNYVDLMLCWGPKMKDLFALHGKIDPDKMAVVGGIAFDQFKLPPPPQQINRTHKRRVMFATGFAYADRNPEYSVPEGRPEDPIHRDMVLTDSRARSKWFEAIKRFWAEHGNDWEIVVKIHPGEREDVYKSVLRDTVSIFPHIPPVLALHHVDAVVHCGSTMAYEAHLLGIPAFNYRNICQDRVVAAISPNFETYEELTDALSKAVPSRQAGLQTNANPAIIAQLEADYYGTVDGNAAERACEAINKLPESQTAIPNNWPENKEFKYITPCILKDVEQWYCKACDTRYNVQGPREMVKCPVCGIANVKMSAAQNPA